MSKGVLISNLDTYIGTALYEELLGPEPDSSEFAIYGTYYNKEVSERPKFVKKMLKQKQKPGLFRKYMLDNMGCFVYDLHSGKLEDLEWGIKALTKTPLESEKTVIVISSVLSWGETPHKMVEDKLIQYDDNGDPIIVADNPDGDADGDRRVDPNADNIDNMDGSGDNMGGNVDGDKIGEEQEFEDDDDDGKIDDLNNPDDPDRIINADALVNNDEPKFDEFGNPIPVPEKKKRRKKKQKKEIKYKRVGYSEEEFEKRIPCKIYEKIKQFEDYLLNLKFENLSIFIICAGLPYGNSETVFNYFFKSSWLQNPEALPYFLTGENLVPTIHVKDLAKIVKKLISGPRPENKYIFAVDQTVDSSLKNIVLNISRGIGSGLTQSIIPDDELLDVLKLNSQDFYIDQTYYLKNDVTLILTEGELLWKNFLPHDIMLNPSKFIEEDFEWHCKEGIPEKMNLLLEEFSKYRRLRPLKIILNCTDKSIRSFYAKRISQFYNIPVINYEKIIEMLSLKIEELNEEEIFMKKKYLDLKEKMEFIQNNPDFKNEENLLLCDPTEIMLEALKFLLKENASENRGYILEGMPVNLEEIRMLYFYKTEILPEDDPDAIDAMDMMNMEEEEYEDDDDGDMGNMYLKIDGDMGDVDKSPDKSHNDSIDKSNNDMMDPDMGDMDNPDLDRDVDNLSDKDNALYGDNMNNNPDNPDNVEPPKDEKKRKKKKKIKPKKYKNSFEKTLLPESVITISFPDVKNKNEVNNIFWEVENFYQENNIEVLNLLNDLNKKNISNEIFEMMRIYIERNSRPFNYFTDNDSDINKKREQYLKQKVRYLNNEKDAKKKKEEEIEKEKEQEYWRKMEKRIEAITKDKEEVEFFDDCPTRKFLLLNIMPILTKGMLEVCKINPIDPVDYLSDFLFKNSTD